MAKTAGICVGITTITVATASTIRATMVTVHHHHHLSSSETCCPP
jgi:hypothetical protein